jgi:tetratricopeptide (TPR) repeat protein
MLSKYKDKAKKLTEAKNLLDIRDKSAEILEEQVPRIKNLVKEKFGPKTRDAIEDDDLMTKVFSGVYDLLMTAHPALRLIVKRERFVNFCLRNRTRLVERIDTKQLIQPEETTNPERRLPMDSVTPENARLAEEYVDTAKNLYNNLIRNRSNDAATCNQIIQACEQSLKYAPNPDAYSLLSRAIHLESTNLPKASVSVSEREMKLFLAINYAAKALEVLPDSPDFHFWKGELFFELANFAKSKDEVAKRLDDAEKEYQTALEIDPQYSRTASSLLQLESKRKLLKQMPDDDNPTALLELAYELYFGKEWPRLRTTCEKALQIGTTKTEIEAAFRKLLAQSLIGLGFVDEQGKRALWQRAVEEARRSTVLYGDSGNPQIVSDAYAGCGLALQLYTTLLSDLNEKIGLIREAIAANEKAVQIKPQNQDAQKQLQQTREQLAHYEEDLKPQKKSGCFIATAAYGSTLAPEVMMLRHFRDDVLLTSNLGTVLVKVYYFASPPLARLISRHRHLQALTRRLWLEPFLHLIKKS